MFVVVFFVWGGGQREKKRYGGSLSRLGQGNPFTQVGTVKPPMIEHQGGGRY